MHYSAELVLLLYILLVPSALFCLQTVIQFLFFKNCYLIFILEKKGSLVRRKFPRSHDNEYQKWNMTNAITEQMIYITLNSCQ